MSTNYSKGQPIGNNGQPQYLSPPAVKAIATYGVSNASASSVITLTHNTTAIEVAATGRSAVVRWIATSDTAASVVAIGTTNFDHVVPAAAMRRFVVPIEVINNAEGYGSVVGANRANGLFQRVAIMADGPGSVYLAEYGSANSY